jgi:exonuclease III
VCDLVRDAKASLVCLQETKLQIIYRATVIQSLGLEFADDFAFLPADGTRGEILLAASSRLMSLSLPSSTPNTISALITDKADGSTWTASGVYGPQGEAQKIEFIAELQALAAASPPRWLVFGDFNLIYKAEDKSNDRLNRRLMRRFKSALDAMRLRELNLSGRRFTWSNEQDSPTMTRIDRFFCSEGWDLSFPSAILQPLPSSLSDHAPLLLVGAADIPRCRAFRFEAFWPRMEGFHEVVQEAWDMAVRSTDPLRRLHVKLERTAKALKRWHRAKFGDLKLQLAIAREVIGRLDVAQEARQLSMAERTLRTSLRSKILGIASINKIRMRQKARLSSIRLGDANTLLFHIN